MAAEDEASTSLTESEVRGESGELQGAPDSDSSANPGSPGIEPKEQKPERKQIVCDPRINILLEEWKKNVDLYIDQDKRGFERIKMFLLIHAGLLVLFAHLWGIDKVSSLNTFAAIGAIVVAIVGVKITTITSMMSNRAHAYILLRKNQAMLIERALVNIVGENPEHWRADLGVLTTFTREHGTFNTKVDPKDPLKEIIQSLTAEMGELGVFANKPFTKEWKPSIGHLDWLNKMFSVIKRLWITLSIILILFYAVQFIPPSWISSIREGILSDTPPASQKNEPSSSLPLPVVGDTEKWPVIGADQQIVDGTGTPPVVGVGQQWVDSAGGQQIVPSTMELAIQGLRQELNDLRTHFDQQWKGIERIETTLNELRNKTPVGTTPPAN